MNFLSVTLLDSLRQFHFIRPYWLLSIVFALLLAALLLRREKANNAWQQHIDPLLLAPLLQGKVNRSGKKTPALVLIFWVLCALALAGPAWEKLPTPIEKRDTALVILLDLSPSMLASDIKPSRLIAARHKILDLLKLRKEGYTALLAYSGDAHVVAPLTDDTQTIANLLNVLEPGIMPVYGSNLEDGLANALQLFEHGGYTQGDILLVTDGVTAQTITHSAAILKNKNITLSIIGVGTEDGAPIPDNAGGFVKNRQGAIILPQLHEEQLVELAKQVNGYYHRLQLDDSDVLPLVESTRIFNQKLRNQDKSRQTEKQFDQWRDIGGILALFLLPLLLIAFRRGVLICFMLALPLLHVTKVHAETPAPTASSQSLWERLWLNDNQRAMKAMEKKDYSAAAKQFKNPDWKAAAQYEAGDYTSALKQFQSDTSAQGLYNQGNALAKSGQLEQAISAYKDALRKNPQFDAAAFNKKIAEELLKQQQKQPQPQKNEQDQKDQSGDNSKKDQDNKNQEDKSQNGQAPDNQEKNKKDQQGDRSDKDSGTPGEQNDKDGSQQQKAHEESDKNKSATDAQQKPTDAGMDKKDDKGQQQPDKANEKASAESKLTPEQKQALDQAMRQVPDDPSGLLRNKFEFFYQQRLQQQQAGKKDKQLNDEERW